MMHITRRRTCLSGSERTSICQAAIVFETPGYPLSLRDIVGVLLVLTLAAEPKALQKDLLPLLQSPLAFVRLLALLLPSAS